MSQVTLTAAARLAGISRATLNRHIRSGRVTKGTDSAGKPCIEIGELERVYGPLTRDADAPHAHPDAAPADELDSADDLGGANAHSDATTHNQDAAPSPGSARVAAAAPVARTGDRFQRDGDWDLGGHRPDPIPIAPEAEGAEPPRPESVKSPRVFPPPLNPKDPTPASPDKQEPERRGSHRAGEDALSTKLVSLHEEIAALRSDLRQSVQALHQYPTASPRSNRPGIGLLTAILFLWAVCSAALIAGMWLAYGWPQVLEITQVSITRLIDLLWLF